LRYDSLLGQETVKDLGEVTNVESDPAGRSDRILTRGTAD
jgi:hypothetical protein